MEMGSEKRKKDREEVEEEKEIEVSKEDNEEKNMQPGLANLPGDHEEKNSDETDVVDKGVDDGRMLEDGHIAKARYNNHVDRRSNVVIALKCLVSDDKRSIRPEVEEGNDIEQVAHGQSAQGNNLSQSLEVFVAPHSESSPSKVECMKEEELENDDWTKQGAEDAVGGGDSGTEDEQTMFMNELEEFYKERKLAFRPPKFYGEPLNLLRLWRAVMRLGGYEKVTACKFWRQVGEMFNPPKTCTTISWTFRIFYEKVLLHYERHRTIGGGPGISPHLPVPTSVKNQCNTQASVSGRTRRDAATRAMQGWLSQRILDKGEVSDPIIKDKSSLSLSKREKQQKNLGDKKRRKLFLMDAAVKAEHTQVPKGTLRSETTVLDIGSPADWVKINVRITPDCYEVYALVPGLLQEEVRILSDPAGRLVISGEPENPDNPWNVTPFKKVVSFPSRIDPHQTLAVATLHGQLFVRVPFELYD